MTGYYEARARVAEYLRQREMQQPNYRTDEIHGLHIDPAGEMAALLASDLKAVMTGPPESAMRPATGSDLGRPRHEEGLYALTRLSKDLPAGPARDLARDVIRRPYRAALAAVLIAAQLGARSDWSGADELEAIGETLAGAGLPGLDEEALYRSIADQFGIAHDGDDEDEEAGE